MAENICSICLNEITKNNEITLECCKQKICKACNNRNITEKCWICRQDKKNNKKLSKQEEEMIQMYLKQCEKKEKNIVSIFIEMNEKTNNHEISKIENNIEDTSDYKNMNIIIESMFPNRNNYYEMFDVSKFSTIEKTILNLKSVNYIFRVIHTCKKWKTEYNLLSLFIDNIIFGKTTTYDFVHAMEMVNIASILIKKNINLNADLKGWTIHEWCKYEYEKFKNKHDEYSKIRFYFYEKTIESMDLMIKQEKINICVLETTDVDTENLIKKEKTKFSFKRLFCCFFNTTTD